jgi:hypothetical protein
MDPDADRKGARYDGIEKDRKFAGVGGSKTIFRHFHTPPSGTMFQTIRVRQRQIDIKSHGYWGLQAQIKSSTTRNLQLTEIVSHRIEGIYYGQYTRLFPVLLFYRLTL